jgi:hypothetical protein
VRGIRVKLRENSFYLWIIVPSDNECLAWSGSRWVPIDRHGRSVEDLEAAIFATAKDAAAESVEFEVEHG